MMDGSSAVIAGDIEAPRYGSKRERGRGWSRGRIDIFRCSVFVAGAASISAVTKCKEVIFRCM